MARRYLTDLIGRYLGLGGATGDSTNPLSVRGVGSLFDGNTTGHQIKVNKASAGQTAGFLFQTGYSGRAEFGILGNNDFTLKTSADGAAWNDAFAVAAATGVLDFKIAPTILGVPLWQDVSDAAFRLADDLDPTKKAMFQLSSFTSGTTRTFTLPNVSGTVAVLSGLAQTFSSQVTFSNAVVDFGTNGSTTTIGIGTGTTTSGNTKTVNIGTAGVSGSTTVVNIGSAVAGALGQTVINTPTVTFANSVTSIGMPEANVTAKYLGLGGATADATNRFSINTPNMLLNHAGAGIDATFNKNAAANDASFSFKTAFASKAILGLLGSDDFTIKVGASFTTAMTIAEATGKVSFPAGIKQLHVGTTAPSSPAVGDLWVDTN
ncbi:hypothetical protein RCMCDREAMY_12 [Rhodobacter phage RcMcDreamy]|nr:hypothetical protein RCMCDREAMY_12 [Rhodobacter phage RcMcDreamy]